MSGQARMLDGYIVCEQERAALPWRTSCASADALKRRIDTQLSAGPLPFVVRAQTGSLRLVGRLGSRPVNLPPPAAAALPIEAAV